MRSNAWPERALAILVACSLEAAWLQLAYVTFQGLTRAMVALPMVAFFAAALAGFAFARWSARHPEVPYRLGVGALVIGAALLGWLVPLGPAVDPLGATVRTLQLHLAGLLLGVAVLRGAAHATLDDEERIAGRALGPGTAGVALLWLLLEASGAARIPPVLEAAFAATVAYVTAALLALGLARLADPRFERAGTGRRTWIGLLLAVVGGLLIVAIPLAVLVGAPAETALRGVLGPVGDVVIMVAALLILPLGVLGAIVVQVLTWLRDTLDLGAPGAVIGQLADQARRLLNGSSTGGVPLGIVPLVLLVILGLLVLRRFLLRPEPVPASRSMVEIRESEPPAPIGGFRRPRLRRPSRLGDPRTASEAYLATLELVRKLPATGRRDEETPQEHARRVRDEAVGPAVARLAADYALVEFGRRTLTTLEHRRAIERWRRVRTLVDRPGRERATKA
jgi:hypothetical protein